MNLIIFLITQTEKVDIPLEISSPIPYWNLSILTRALSPILNIKRSEKVLEAFGEIFTAKYTKLLRAKLGLEKNMKVA